jgi:hypothetical protein
MAFQNGSGNGGGNTSVFWEINGPPNGPSRPMLANAVSVASIPGATLKSGTGREAESTPVGLLDVDRHVNRGEIKITNAGIEGHTDTDFSRIGRSNPPTPDDHAGMFRVRLRFQDADLDKLPPADREWIQQRAKRIPELDRNSWFLFIDVPAIHRDQPPDQAPWSNQPWEIHWEW